MGVDMITRADLAATKMRFTMHADFSDCFQNHYHNDAHPRFTCIVTSPRRRNSKVIFSKRFVVDGVEVFRCSELLERLNAPRLALAEKGEAA